MISIVAHGIMGTAYRQDVVVDEGVTENGSLQVLHDIRRQLSTQYGDDTPMMGWALQPAPVGMWLSHIERAFDANYAPGYVMVSFLIPQGKRFRPKAAQTIEHALVVNHAKFMQQSVVLHRPDWSFLHLLGRELEGLLEDATVVVSGDWKEGNGAACFSGDISSLLTYSWDSRFQQYEVIYCGNRILSADKEFPLLDVIVQTHEDNGICGGSAIISHDGAEINQMNDESENDNTEDETIQIDELEELCEDSVTGIMDKEEDVDRREDDTEVQPFQKTIAGSAGSSYKQDYSASKPHSDKTQQDRKSSGKDQRRINDFAGNVLVVLGIVVVLFLMYKVLYKIPESTRQTGYFEDSDIDEIKDSIAIEENVPVVEVAEEAKKEMPRKEIVKDSKEPVVRNEASTPEVSKINISSANKLFLCLTWDNVKDNGKLFYEKYEVTEPSLKKRVDNIIHQANKMGKARYLKGYLDSSHDSNQHDRLYNLEKYIWKYSPM